LSGDISGVNTYRAVKFADPLHDQDLVTRKWIYDNFLSRSGNYISEPGSPPAANVIVEGSTLTGNIRLILDQDNSSHNQGKSISVYDSQGSLSSVSLTAQGVLPSHITRKDYVDTKISLQGIETIDPATGGVNAGFGTMTGPLILSRDPNGSDDPKIAATKNYVNSQDNGKLSIQGTSAVNPVTGQVDASLGTMTGPLILSRDPQESDPSTIAATKRYVDNAFKNPSVDTLAVLSTANSVSTETGALTVAGGVGIRKDVWIGGNLFLDQSLFVAGTQFITNSNSIVTGDKLIVLSSATRISGLATDSGISIGPADVEFVNFLYDGDRSWKSKGNLIPSGVYSLGTENNPWDYLYVNHLKFKEGGNAVTEVKLTAKPGISVTNNSTSTSTVAYDIANIGVLSIRGSTAIAVSNSTGTVVVTNLGVTSLTGGPSITVSASTGNVTINSLGVTQVLGSTAIAVSTSTGSIVVTNLGVTQVLGSTAIAVSTSTGSIVVTNLGVTQVQGGGGITVSTSTGSVIITSAGVTQIQGSTAIAVSTGTGTVVVTNLGVTQVQGGAAIAVSNSTGSVVINNLGVVQVTTGSGITVSTSTGAVTIQSIDTIQLVTNRGNTTTNSLSITNSAASISTVTGALVVAGGIGVGGNVNIGGSLSVASSFILSTNIASTSTQTGTLVVAGGIGVGGDITPSGLRSAAAGSTVYGTWTLATNASFQATYADLAEWYASDQEYEAGTVLVFGGDAEVTTTTNAYDSRVAGVVTTDPAYVMNVGQTGTRVCIALVGRVPVKVIGPVNKGDLLTTADIPGYARRCFSIRAGTIIGKSLENKSTVDPGVVMVSVSRN
jgi:hypothetical protein